MNTLMQGFLDNDSFFGRFMTKLGIIIAANIMFVLLSIPFFTIGAGLSGKVGAKLSTGEPGGNYYLKADLIERTGLDISKVEVGHIDYLRDVAYVKVYYKPIDGEVNTIDTITKLKDFEV